MPFPTININRKKNRGVKMAYENGNRIEDYFSSLIEHYKKDNMIFVKSLAILTTYLNRSDWPHCIEELEETLNPILGDSLEFIGFRGFYFDDDYIKWPSDSDIPSQFRQDAIAFYKTVNPIVMQYYYNRLEPLKLYSIVTTKNDYEPDNKIVRFIRNDGKSLEVKFDNYAIHEAIKVLSNLLENVDNGA